MKRGGNKKVKFENNGVIDYLEEKLLDDLATDDELGLYIFYKKYGYFDKGLYTYRKLVREMKDIYEGRM